MNRERAKYLAPLIQAYGEGKDIWYRGNTNSKFTTLDGDVGFGDLCAEYEIKPEPEVIYVNIYETDVVGNNLAAHKTKKQAEKFLMSGGVTKKFTEVLE